MLWACVLIWIFLPFWLYNTRTLHAVGVPVQLRLIATKSIFMWVDGVGMISLESSFGPFSWSWISLRGQASPIEFLLRVCVRERARETVWICLPLLDFGHYSCWPISVQFLWLKRYCTSCSCDVKRLLIFDLLRLWRGVYGGIHICNVPLSESVNLCPSDP